MTHPLSILAWITSSRHAGAIGDVQFATCGNAAGFVPRLAHKWPTTSGRHLPPVASACLRRPRNADSPRPRNHSSGAVLAGVAGVVWQVLGSNQRRLSRRFYSPILLSESCYPDLRLRVSRRNLGQPPSAMRPWALGFGVRAVHRPWQNRLRTGTDRSTDEHGPAHGRRLERPRTGPARAVTPTVHPASWL
jgi:hypothetical protein